MNILIYSHSSAFGGGENALKNLVSILLEHHSVDIIFPNKEGHLIEYFLSKNVTCYQYPYTHAVPNLAVTLSNYSELRMADIFKSLSLDKKKYDCVISNTVVLLEGIFASKYLNVPHITYAHEYLDDPNLEPNCFSSKRYLSVVTNESHQLLTCSTFLKDILGEQSKTEVLYPFPFTDPINHSLVESDITDVLVIGTRSIRKNMHFAVAVQKALKLRGRLVKLHFIGNDNTGSNILRQTVAHYNEPVEFYDPTLDVYFLKDRKVVTLITALSEPFGLTIVESMQRGIPVVSSRSGGPQELLDDAYLFDINNIDQCVRSLEKVIDNYSNSCNYSSKKYLQLKKKNSRSTQLKIVEKVLKSSIANYTNNEFLDPILKQIELFKTLHTTIVSSNDVISNISAVSKIKVSKILETMTQEKNHEGIAVLNDMYKFDAVPFGDSPKLNDVYANGYGLAIQLTDTMHDPNKAIMISNILLKLLEYKENVPKTKVLAIGDGLGIDSIKLTECGFDVDYMDYDNSLMSEIAKTNAKNFKLKFVNEIKKKYDAVICLEVIEHVPDVFSFIDMLSNALKPNGLLFISECFDGVRDIWATHLLVNERYAASLFLLLLPYFELIDYNTIPYGKPYVFSKRNNTLSPEDISKALTDRTAMIEFINSKIKLGV